ncbi:hypothetical protein ZWY2020_055354 [Hordeum vulgare]|nr:hypothetical protein ZWY2020_055354 [Hordeum vulgare]
MPLSHARAIPPSAPPVQGAAQLHRRDGTAQLAAGERPVRRRQFCRPCICMAGTSLRRHRRRQGRPVPASFSFPVEFHRDTDGFRPSFPTCCPAPPFRPCWWTSWIQVAVPAGEVRCTCTTGLRKPGWIREIARLWGKGKAVTGAAETVTSFPFQMSTPPLPPS